MCRDCGPCAMPCRRYDAPAAHDVVQPCCRNPQSFSELVHAHANCRGARVAFPFGGINCNTVPENLPESELFGHETGAFTARAAQTTRRNGCRGTVFRDEIGDLPPSVQVELLRFLQEKCFQRVGGRLEIQSNASVIAATNRNLQESVASGKFREDLYFRLAVIVIKVPPLLEREVDTVLVAKAFLNSYGVEHAKPGLSFAPDALRALSLHRWPGNVRELQNRVRRAVITADGKRLSARDLELTDTLSALPPQTLKEARESVERGPGGSATSPGEDHVGRGRASALAGHSLCNDGKARSVRMTHSVGSSEFLTNRASPAVGWKLNLPNGFPREIANHVQTGRRNRLQT